MLADGLERVLYDQGVQPLAQGRGRIRRTWVRSLAADGHTESISLPSREFARELCNTIHDRDYASFIGVVASMSELAVYHRIYEGLQFKQYLKRSIQGLLAAWIWFQLRLGTLVLTA